MSNSSQKIVSRVPRIDTLDYNNIRVPIKQDYISPASKYLMYNAAMKEEDTYKVPPSMQKTTQGLAISFCTTGDLIKNVINSAEILSQRTCSWSSLFKIDILPDQKTTTQHPRVDSCQRQIPEQKSVLIDFLFIEMPCDFRV